jgi:hypothetical protein
MTTDYIGKKMSETYYTAKRFSRFHNIIHYLFNNLIITDAIKICTYIGDILQKF